jgi:hypothetical protein
MISARMVPILSRWGDGGNFMNSILILFALSAISGFVLASCFSWRAILAAGAVLVPLSAVVFQNRGFGALSGIAVIVSCLAINQAAYVVGAIRASEGPNGGSAEDLPHQQADDVPRDGRDDDIRREHNGQQNTQFNLAHLAEQRHADPTR